MLEFEPLTRWEWIWLFLLCLIFLVPFTVMIISPSRGNFLLWYSYIFGLIIQWNFFHGWSDVDDQVLWAELAAEWLNINKKELPNSKPIYIGSRKWMFVTNHTSMADLFLMDVLLAGRWSYLARYGVIAFCPLPMIVTLVMNSIWFFKRGGRGNDLEPFFQFLDGNFNWFQTARYHLACFPEGHRAVKPYMLPLKEGMIRYAYERKLIVQPIVIFGVENAMNEFTFRREIGSKFNLEYFAADIIDPEGNSLALFLYRNGGLRKGRSRSCQRQKKDYLKGVALKNRTYYVHWIRKES